jgi:hypothetical protein
VAWLKRHLLPVLAALVVGIVIGLASPVMIARHINTEWKPLAPGEHHFGISYATDAIFTDLPMPDIKSVSGKAKFVDAAGRGEPTEFGYIVTVEMADLDLAKVPDRYKKTEKDTINGYEVTTEPLKQAYYKVEWEFQFKDKDGFLLGEYKAPEEISLVSGKTNVFQGKLQDKIPYDTAIRVHQIEIYPAIVKCHSCKPK